MIIKIAAVRFAQEVKIPIYGERRGLANQPQQGQALQFDVEMTFDPSTALLTITPTRANCGLPPVLIPREGIMWMEPVMEPVPVPHVAPTPTPSPTPPTTAKAKGKATLNGIILGGDE